MEAMSVQFRSRTFYVTVLLTFASLATLSACAGDPGEPTAIGTGAPVIVPSGPGAPARTAAPGERIAGPSEAPTAADVRFVEGMIPHHRQALEMTAMVAGRTDNPGILRVAEQIALTQEPEIKTMATWLTALGRPIPDAHEHRPAGQPATKGGPAPGQDGTAPGLAPGQDGAAPGLAPGQDGAAPGPAPGQDGAAPGLAPGGDSTAPGAAPGRDGTAPGPGGGNGLVPTSHTNATPESDGGAAAGGDGATADPNAGAMPGSEGGATAEATPGAVGMASPQELDALRAARGAAFDQMFLRLMIRHHEGALTMADDVLRHGRDQRIRMLAREVYSGQNLEIARMKSIRVTG
jgi:uncharacterized protein (DUF305 family)